MSIFNLFKKKEKLVSPVLINKEYQPQLQDANKNMALRRSIYGLTAEEIFFLEYTSGHDSDISTFSKKYKYEYGINYDETISYLISNNYIQIGTVKESLELYNTQELKNFLKECGLPLSGNKATLIQRIVDSCEEYNDKFTKRKFVLTDKGRNVIEQYKSNHNLPKTEQEKLNYQFMEYSKNVQKHLQEGNLGLYACDLYSMSEVYRKEHCYNDQLQVLMESAYIHLSGIETLKDFYSAVSNHFKYSGLHPMVPPAVIQGIERALKSLNMDIPTFRTRFKENIDLTLTPAHIFGIDKSLEIICLYLEGNSKKAEKEIENGTKKFILSFK